jgi:hypothetical protein
MTGTCKDGQLSGLSLQGNKIDKAQHKKRYAGSLEKGGEYLFFFQADDNGSTQERSQRNGNAHPERKGLKKPPGIVKLKIPVHYPVRSGECKITNQTV